MELFEALLASPSPSRGGRGVATCGRAGEAKAGDYRHLPPGRGGEISYRPGRSSRDGRRLQTKVREDFTIMENRLYWKRVIAQYRGWTVVFQIVVKNSSHCFSLSLVSAVKIWLSEAGLCWPIYSI